MIKVLKIKNILVSQPAPSSDKSPFSEIASKHNMSIDFRPFIEVQGVDAKEFRGQRVDILEHTAVIFTSRTTIDHFFRVCDENRIAVPEHLKYFCVTEAIALYLQKYIVYRKRKIFFGKGNFANLMELIVKHKEDKFLVPLSDPHKPEIPQTLDQAKIKYSKVILSHTVPSNVDDLNIDNYDILVFYSPMEINSLVDNFKDSLGKMPKIATFGAGTAKAALAAGLNIAILVPTPKVPSMTMAIDKYVGLYNSGGDVSEFAAAELPDTPVYTVKPDPKSKTRARKSPATAATVRQSTQSAK